MIVLVAGDVAGLSLLVPPVLNFTQWGGGWRGVCDPSLRPQTCSLFVFTLWVISFKFMAFNTICRHESVYPLCGLLL